MKIIVALIAIFMTLLGLTWNCERKKESSHQIKQSNEFHFQRTID